MPDRHRQSEFDDDRREQLRRDEDVEKAAIVDHAVHDAPIVNRLLHTGRVVTAAVAITAFVTTSAAALGWRMIGPRQDIVRIDARLDEIDHLHLAAIARLSARVDSNSTVIRDIRHDVELSAYIQCVFSRRSASDLRPPGCDETEQRVRSRKP
jgi:hypothetical protein